MRASGALLGVLRLRVSPRAKRSLRMTLLERSAAP